MRYTGGKNAAGTYQQIINQLPPHAVYVEPFLGSGAVLRLKRPAPLNIAIEISAASLEKAMPAVIAKFGDAVPIVTSDERRRETQDSKLLAPLVTNGDGGSPGTLAISGDARSGIGSALAILGDARSELPKLPIAPDWLIYADPPYLGSTRTRRHYQHEIFTDREHRDLLQLLKSLPCMIALSGYPSKLYDRELKDWRLHTFEAVNRAGQTVTECLWMNYPEPMELHEYTYLGKNFRERERIKRKTNRWINRLQKMPLLERASLFMAIAAAHANSGDDSRN